MQNLISIFRILFQPCYSIPRPLLLIGVLSRPDDFAAPHTCDALFLVADDKNREVFLFVNQRFMSVCTRHNTVSHSMRLYGCLNMNMF